MRKRAQASLVVAIDADTHAVPEQGGYDPGRAAWLQERGYKVIRFDAGGMGRYLAGVVEAIRAACEAGVAGLGKVSS